MATDIPRSLNISVSQSVIDGFASALGGLELVIKLGDDVDSALLDFMRRGNVAETITLSYRGCAREEGRGIPGLSPTEAHDAIAAVLHAVISDSLGRRPIFPTPASAFDMIELAYRIATNMIRETSRVLILTDTARVNHVRDGEWDALARTAWPGLTSKRWLVEQAMGLAYDALLVSTPKRLAANYAKGCAPELDAYLYHEDLDTWYADLVKDCVRDAANERSFRRRLVPLPPDDELAAADDEDVDDDDDAAGGIFDRANVDLPPGRPGGGIAPPSVSSRRHDDYTRDQRRLASLRELVATAERVLSRKQRSALVTKLFSPKQDGAREAMMLICLEAVREVPREVRDDDELATLVGSPTASAAQRNDISTRTCNRSRNFSTCSGGAEVRRLAWSGATSICALASSESKTARTMTRARSRTTRSLSWPRSSRASASEPRPCSGRRAQS